ncbi:hypothetical protein BSKO_01434 [Bryopsis sp. KO-2023]|nr:hypothetical protein BSKO_01434 [Bryopsis sp. KO-2023]
MADPPQAQVANGQQQQQQQQRPSLLSSLFRMMFMWWVMSFIRGNNQKGHQNYIVNTFTRGELMDLALFVDEDPSNPLRYPSHEMWKSDPVWQLEGIGLAIEPTVSKNVTIELTEDVQNNGTLFLHALLSRQGYEINPGDPSFDPASVVHSVVQLNKYMPKRKVRIHKNLLASGEEKKSEGEEETQSGGGISGEDAKDVEVDAGAGESNKTEIISYLKPLMTVAMVDDFTRYSDAGVPPHIAPLMNFDEDGNYLPMIFFNQFWILKENMIPINDTIDSTPIEITVASIKSWQMQLALQFEQSLELQSQWGMADNDGKESDEFKKILTDSNPILLGITMIVSLLHSVFEFMAFKSDIGFWKDNKSMKGLSAKSIMINTACQLIVTLYLLDNETNFMVMFGQIVGLVIECWKITKAMHVSVVWYGSIPMLNFKERQSYSEGNTKEHDDKAMVYLSYVLFPLVVCYSIYNLMYEEHKSWYSWVLSSLVGAVYMFGFILMCPQLYLNYKLKSVAHLPAKQLTYKFLTTIIDDLFAFAIKMPPLHRLAVFRDDLVFVAFLYQWYMYGVDKKRVNEFGYSSEAQPEELENDGDATAEGTTAAAGSGESVDDSKDAAKDASVRRRKPEQDSQSSKPVGHIEEIDDEEEDTKKEQ